ncbi:MAG: hypothetical protein M1837_007504 [Sclerophora amabilis]|nr:MAG: hypothetical protein M1837_007504 [Sclerophora amabilis]
MTSQTSTTLLEPLAIVAETIPVAPVPEFHGQSVVKFPRPLSMPTPAEAKPSNEGFTLQGSMWADSPLEPEDDTTRDTAQKGLGLSGSMWAGVTEDPPVKPTDSKCAGTTKDLGLGGSRWATVAEDPPQPAKTTSAKVPQRKPPRVNKRSRPVALGKIRGGQKKTPGRSDLAQTKRP